MGEGDALRRLDAEKRAKWPPALPHVVDQQPVGGDPRLDLLDVLVEDIDGVRPVEKPARKGALPDQAERPGGAGPQIPEGTARGDVNTSLEA